MKNLSPGQLSFLGYISNAFSKQSIASNRFHIQYICQPYFIFSQIRAYHKILSPVPASLFDLCRKNYSSNHWQKLSASSIGNLGNGIKSTTGIRTKNTRHRIQSVNQQSLRSCILLSVHQNNDRADQRLLLQGSVQVRADSVSPVQIS